MSTRSIGEITHVSTAPLRALFFCMIIVDPFISGLCFLDPDGTTSLISRYPWKLHCGTAVLE